jgi:hypothetical protein
MKMKHKFNFKMNKKKIQLLKKLAFGLFISYNLLILVTIKKRNLII